MLPALALAIAAAPAAAGDAIVNAPEHRASRGVPPAPVAFPMGDAEYHGRLEAFAAGKEAQKVWASSGAAPQRRQMQKCVDSAPKLVSSMTQGMLDSCSTAKRMGLCAQAKAAGGQMAQMIGQFCCKSCGGKGGGGGVVTCVDQNTTTAIAKVFNPFMAKPTCVNVTTGKPQADASSKVIGGTFLVKAGYCVQTSPTLLAIVRQYCCNACNKLFVPVKRSQITNCSQVNASGLCPPGKAGPASLKSVAESVCCKSCAAPKGVCADSSDRAVMAATKGLAGSCAEIVKAKV